MALGATASVHHRDRHGQDEDDERDRQQPRSARLLHHSIDEKQTICHVCLCQQQNTYFETPGLHVANNKEKALTVGRVSLLRSLCFFFVCFFCASCSFAGISRTDLRRPFLCFSVWVFFILSGAHSPTRWISADVRDVTRATRKWMIARSAVQTSRKREEIENTRR